MKRWRGRRRILQTLGTLTLVYLSACMATGEAQSKVKRDSPRQPKALHADLSRATVVPEFSFIGLPEIDEAGNIYFQLGPLHSAAQIFRLVRSDEGNSEILRVPAEFSKNDVIDFTVTASGEVYLLTVDHKNLYHVIRLESGGNLKDIQLDAPAGLWLSALGVFENATGLVVGHFGPDAAEELRGMQYAALFDSFGKRLSDLREQFSVRKSTSDRSSKYDGYAIRPGSDGNLYLLEPSLVRVVSASGATVRKLKFIKPDPDDDAIGLSVSGGMICIELSRAEPGATVKAKFLLLDMVTGKDMGYFSAPEQESTWIGFTPTDGFIFVTEELDKMKIFSVAVN